MQKRFRYLFSDDIFIGVIAIALVAIVLTLVFVAVNLVSAAISDYEYAMTIAIDNQSGSALADTPIAVTMNPSGMIAQSFLQADAEDWLPVDVNQTELDGVAQGMSSSSQPWWIDVTQADGSLSLYEFHMGYSSATRDQRFRFDGTTDTITVTDHADLDITDDLLIEATIELVVWPTVTSTAYLIRKEGAYEIEVGVFAGASSITGTVTSAGDSQSVVTVLDENYDALVAGVEYIVALYYDKDLASDNLKIYINDEVVNAEDFTDSLASTASDVVIGSGVNGYIDALFIDPPIIHENYVTGDDDSATTVFGSEYLSQTFTAEETYYLSSFRLKLLGVDEPNLARVYLYSVSDGYPDASLIPTITVDVSDISTSTPTWITFPLSSPYEIQAGSEYAIQLRNSSTAAGEITWQADSSSPTYSGGRALKSNAGASVWYSGFASVTEINEQVGADADDTYLSDDWNDGETLGTGSVKMGGYHNTDRTTDYRYSPGIRFTTVGVPTTNARIIDSYLTFTPDDTYNDSDIFVSIYGELADTGSFTTAADYTDRTKTTEHVHYSGAKWWTQDVEEDLTAMPLVVQAMVDDVGWSQNSAMVFLLTGTSTDIGVEVVHGYDHETDLSKAVMLYLAYVDDDDATGDFLFETWGLGGSANKVAFDFEPDELVSTQVGNSGNSWVWTGTVEDVSTGGSDHDGVYSLTRDMSGITTWAYDLGAKDLPTPVPTPTVVNTMGQITLTPEATRAGTQFLFRDELEGVLEHADIGITALAAWFVFLTGLGLVVSAIVWLGTKNSILVALPLPVAYWIGYGLGTPIPLWLPLMFTLVAVGIAFGLKRFVD